MADLAKIEREKFKKQDPFTILGVGIKNYFRILEKLIACFFVFSLFSVA